MKLAPPSRLPILSPRLPLARMGSWARAGTTGVHTALGAMGAALCRAWTAHQSRRRLAHHERLLRGLDERLLRDIGAPEELIAAARQRAQAQRMLQPSARLTDR